MFPDLLRNIGLSVSGLRKMRFNTYTPNQISTKNQFPKKPGFPLSVLIILVWYPYVSLFPDLLCNIGLSVSGVRQMHFNAYTPCRISTKNQFPNKPGFSLSTLIIWVMWTIFSWKKKAEKHESWSIKFTWQSQSLLSSSVEIWRN